MRICTICGKSEKQSPFRGPTFRQCRRCQNDRHNEARRKRYVTAESYGEKRPANTKKYAPKIGTNAALQGEPKTPDVILTEHWRDRELRNLRDERVRLVEALADARARAGIVQTIKDNYQAPPILRREKKSGLREATAVALLSDAHIEEPVNPEKVNGLNEYNVDIADKRLDRFVSGAVWLTEMHRSKFKIRDMVLWLGGDLFTGYIHEELMEEAAMSPINSVLWLRRKLTQIIDALLLQLDLERLIIPCTPGNHGRTTIKKRIATNAENSFEWLLYQILAGQYSSEPRVQVVAPLSQLVYQRVYGTVLRFAHGDEIGFQGGIGGLSIPLNKKVAKWNEGVFADVTNIGHWHSYNAEWASGTVRNGSVIGHSPYAVRIGAGYEDPVQAYYLVDSLHGACCSTPIWLTEASKG